MSPPVASIMNQLLRQQDFMDSSAHAQDREVMAKPAPRRQLVVGQFAQPIEQLGNDNLLVGVGVAGHVADVGPSG